MPRWMINCEEHSRLASRDLDGPLSFWDRLSAGLHRWICPPCRQFKKQLDTIRTACKDGSADFDEDQGSQSATLPEDACRRMKAAIREHLTR
ncbi:MAG: hypothetical protein P8Z73_07605 [Desulfobacteraceae bacterium]|jgi:hypothetical protein